MSEKFSSGEPNRFSNGWGDYDAMLETLESGLTDREWLVGDRFSAADVMVGSSVVFMSQFGILPESEALSAYADRCLARPAYARARELEEEPAG